MKVLYTNSAASVEEWITNAEGSLDSSARKIVGLDVEYDKLSGTYFNPKKAAVIQLCVGTDVLVYHICHADERSESLDIQEIWRDPDKKKKLQGLKDVAGAIIDPIYFEMKDGFGRAEHRMWANPPPLPPKHLEYAARDAYATYEVYRRLDLFERGFFSLFKHPEKKRGRDW
ncbi:uncharacterized protein [Lolium perenne]|uniref:uncharacterized protein n=1 Tax=Lolium perenne TaxID=4522 RepID=UPI0021F52418|nr:uncharacterized protein LOC127310021 [Lolium perenne]